jgi:hypothetical protein
MTAKPDSSRQRDPMMLILRPGRGSAEIYLGQNEKQVRRILGVPRSIVGKYKAQYFYNYPALGIEVDFGKKGGRAKYLYFFREGVRKHRQAAVVTTDGLKPADPRTKVLRKLGRPDRSGKGITLTDGGFFGEWMTYNQGITFEFGPDHRIDMITILRPKVLRKRAEANRV